VLETLGKTVEDRGAGGRSRNIALGRKEERLSRERGSIQGRLAKKCWANPSRDEKQANVKQRRVWAEERSAIERGRRA